MILPKNNEILDLQHIRKNLPEHPGVYQFWDAQKIIYVGKAKNLKKRVNSYFNKDNSHDFKTQQLVQKILNITYTITNSDAEAFLLENNLIKTHQPKYNILLKDGKTYPYICIQKEPFPRVFSTRQKISDGSTYFGPYPSGTALVTLLNYIRKHYKLRTCSHLLTPQNIQKQKFRICLEYHVGNCLAPCVGKQSEEDYNRNIYQITQILKGNYSSLLQELTQEMKLAAQNLNFEYAQQLKQQLDSLQEYKRKNTIVSENIGNVEVISIVQQDHLAVAHHFKIQGGAIMRTHAFDIKIQENETSPEIFEAVISHLIAEDESFYPEIITNINSNTFDFQSITKITQPQRGEKYQVLLLSQKNAQTLLDEKLNRIAQKKARKSGEELLQRAQQDLRLDKIPLRIECFDNSNIQGEYAVSACVVFIDAKPAKKEYRHFNVKTVSGPDDFATMREVVLRRYKRQLADNKELPDLILIDGGKGQLSHALEALQELNLHHKIPAIGIAKRLEELYYPGDPVPLHLDIKSPTLRLLQRIRDEAHRFGITFHRDKRSRETLTTALTEIPGIGAKTAQKLLHEFKSVKRIKELTLDELSKVVGEKLAQNILESLAN
ncbi:MAG: excinuclease ABC subunit UvrC [Bacteroidia bacterium]|nr:excinuclease ABC subunit UvrC [Bacteroidia bacterium]